MENLNFSEFTRKILITASIEQLWSLWTTSHGISQWFLESCVYTDPAGTIRQPGEACQAGDRYAWKWFNWDTRESGAILQQEEYGSFLFEFAESKVALQMEAQGPRVLITLRQFEIPQDPESLDKVYFGCSNGWSFWLTNLKA